MRELEVGHRGLQLRLGERAQHVERLLGAGAGAEVRGAEVVAEQLLEEERLLVRRRAAGQRARAVAGRLERARRGRDRLVPARRHQLGAFAHQRLDDPLLGVHGLVAEAALVAQPAVVDLVVIAREHAQHAFVADGQLDVALRRAAGADRARALDIPRARAEAVGARRQSPHRTELDDVAAERGDVRVAVERADIGRRAALVQHELIVLGDLLRVAHAAVAEDAALAVDRDQRRQLERLLEVALGLDEAARPGSPAVGDVLQRALAALVADRAVERVIDEQELDHRALGLVHALRLRVDDHPVADRRRARRLQLRDALDLDQAHAAGADGLAEFGVVTEDRDLDVAVLGAVDQHHALGRLHFTPIERERDRLDGRARHQAAGWSKGMGPAWASRLVCGIAIPSPASSRLASM